jgi:hypothetical protein
LDIKRQPLLDGADDGRLIQTALGHGSHVGVSERLGVGFGMELRSQ